MKVLAGSLLLLISLAFSVSQDPPATPKCETNESCAPDQVCSAEGACLDACADVKCGVNSACVVYRHAAGCLCNNGFGGDPLTECTPDKPLCADATDCSAGQACSGGKCIAEQCVDKTCGENALCSEGQCVCDLGYSGDPATACALIALPEPAPVSDNAESVGDVQKPCCAANLHPQPIGKKQFHVIHRHKANWHNAFLYCQAHGMQLATIENEQENKEILEKIGETSIRNSAFYVSGTDYGLENHWMWMTTGLPISNFSYWHTSRPIFNGYAYNCMEYLEKDATTGYRWADGLCYYYTEQHFICQDYA